MIDWKSRLYEGYVSTGQAADVVKEQKKLSLDSYPQYMHLIDHHMPKDKSSRVIDLGCGHGSLVYCLKSLGYTNVRGVDVSTEQVEIAHQLGLNEIQQASLVDFLKTETGKYDVVFLMDILEHLEKQEILEILDLVNSVLVKGGKVIIHVPNGEGIFGMRIRYGDFTHQVCFTPQSMHQILRATGFSQVEVFEDKPITHSLKSIIRLILWEILTLRERLLLLAETGSRGHVLSQNMLITATKLIS